MRSQIPCIVSKLAHLRDAVSDVCPLMGMRTRSERRRLASDVIPGEIQTTKLCGYVVNSAAESLDSIGIRNTRQVCIGIASLYDSRIADYACIQSTATACIACSVCADTSCCIEISIHFYSLVGRIIRDADTVESDSTLECSIARNSQFGEWSVWLQRHKVGNARSCAS